jgi:hypothetical protein
MALIAGFPNLAAAAKPTAADLNSAITKIVEQIGGVDGEGVLHPGNLEVANHVAAPGFRNSQKLEPSAIFCVTAGTLLPDAAAGVYGPAAPRLMGQSIGPFPFDARIVGATLSAEGSGFTLTEAGLKVFVNEEVAATLAAIPDRAWILDVLLRVGDVVRVESHGAVYSAGGPATELRAALWCKAYHRS